MAAVGAPLTQEDKVDNLERLLRQKLESDTGFADASGQAFQLHRVFRHFDSDHSGVIGIREFSAALVRLNFVGCQADVQALFDRYDEDGSGSLTYDEFCGSVFKLTPSVKNDPNSRSVVERVRAKIASRGGLNGIRTLGRIMRTMDDNGNGKLDRYEMAWGLRDYGVEVSEKDLDVLFKAFDRNKDGSVSFNELLRGIRGKLNKRRRAIILQAFDVLDKDKSGQVEMHDVAKAYDTSKHPEVLEGSKTPEEVLKQFMGQWDTIEKDGIITREEFLDYYKDVSASVDTDDYFELMIRNAWHISGGEGHCANTSNKRILVVHYDGSQEIVAIKDDLGLDLTDAKAVKAKLREQGITSVAEIKL